MTVSSKQQGFTLIEVIIALAIFATISILAYKGIDQLLKTKGRIDEEDQRWQQLMVFFDRFEADVRHHINHPVRNWEDQLEPAWFGKPTFRGEEDAQLSLSRLGEADQTGFLMDSRRVGYRFKEGVIETVLWPALDMAPASKVEVFKLVDHVADFSIAYLNPNGQWSSVWPVNPVTTDPISYYPRAVSLSITLQSGESISRIFSL